MDTQSIITTKSGVQKIGKPGSMDLPKIKDQNVNLRDRINDALSTEKHTLVSYQFGINETINDDLRTLFVDNRNRIQGAQISLFGQLFNLGEYQADIATNPQIKDTLDIFINYKSQLPYKQ